MQVHCIFIFSTSNENDPKQDFLNDMLFLLSNSAILLYEHSSSLDSPPSNPRHAGNVDKGLKEEPSKYSNPHSHGDDYKIRLGSSNSKGKFEMGKDDLGRGNK